MQISLRSQLAAGVAFAGAAAIAVTPVAGTTVQSLERVSANLQMAAWANPISELGASLGLLGQSLFSQDAGIPIPVIDDVIGVVSPLGLLPQLLEGSLVVGEGPITTVSGTPILTQVGLNLSSYLLSGVDVLEGVTDAVGAVAFGVPLIVFDVVASLIEDGTIPDIGALVETYIIDPITAAVDTAINAGTEIFTTVLNNVTNLFTALPEAVIGLSQTVIGGLLYTGTALVNTVTDAFGALTSLQFQDAWNVTVEGLLGPDGLIGNLTALSLGNGVFTGDVDTPFIPSLRQALTAGTTGVALTINPEFTAPPAAAEAPAAAASVSAPAAVGDDAPAVEVEAPAAPAAVEASPALEGDAAEAPAPSVRKSARAAAAAAAATAGDDSTSEKKSAPRASRKAASE